MRTNIAHGASIPHVLRVIHYISVFIFPFLKNKQIAYRLTYVVIHIFDIQIKNLP